MAALQLLVTSTAVLKAVRYADSHAGTRAAVNEIGASRDEEWHRELAVDEGMSG